jgi:integrase
MASLTKDSKGFGVLLVCPDGERRKIRLGKKTTKKQAEGVKSRIERVAAAVESGQTLEREDARWLADIGDNLHRKLVRCSLVEPRKQHSATVIDLVDDYIEKQSTKESTKTKWRTTRGHLLKFFSSEKRLKDVTEGDADDFRSYLRKHGQSENTLRRYVGISKQFFEYAKRHRLIESNPFDGQKTTVSGNESKRFFVDRSMSDKILDACPDTEWRVIFALMRYGGLRCPSEVLELRWQDVNWEEGKFLVRSPKTEHHEGKATRWVPLFPELRVELEAAFEQAEDGAVYVIEQRRAAHKNLRKVYQKILLRAGVAEYPKLFQNLRSTRETELADEFPLQCVTAWIGNSESVAKRHYLQVTDDHFARAASEKVDHIVDQHAATSDGTDEHHQRKSPCKTGAIPREADRFRSVPVVKMGDEGLEPPTSSL